MDQLRIWFSTLDKKQRLRLGLATVALFAIGYWMLNQSDSDVGQPAPTESVAQVESGGVAQVHVVGEVAKPGLYEIALGSRVQDAVAAAGGFTSDAIQHSVNLARTVSDGEQIVVLGPTDVVGSTGGGLISLNRADAQQLESLPGVGPSLAAAIVEHRKAIGSFSDIRELREVSGIGEKLFARIKDQVTL